MSLGSSFSSQRDDAFETIACLAWVVMAIVDCYIGLILSNGCFLLEWVIVVSCPVAHLRSYRIVVFHSTRFIRGGRSMGPGVRVWSLAVSFLILFFGERGARNGSRSSFWVMGPVYKKSRIPSAISVLLSGDIWVGYMQIYYMQERSLYLNYHSSTRMPL
eukprot:scaffold22519_cov27-Attheya_sp.AAC.1